MLPYFLKQLRVGVRFVSKQFANQTQHDPTGYQRTHSGGGPPSRTPRKRPPTPSGRSTSTLRRWHWNAPAEAEWRVGLQPGRFGLVRWSVVHGEAGVGPPAKKDLEVTHRIFALLGLALICTSGCQRIDNLRIVWKDFGLSFSYRGEGSVTEWASAAHDTRVIATAKRLGAWTTADPDVSEVEIEETHFVKGTTQVVYKGRVVFRCKTAQQFCEPAKVIPEFGTRQRDVFWRWLARLDGPPNPLAP